MHIAPSRPLALSGCTLVAAALIGSIFIIPRPAHAADAKPAKKDSNPRIRPKEVTLIPSVKPAEARAGETVMYQVWARLDPGWHIYKYVAGHPSLRDTTFDFFDTAGLKIAGDWTASKPATRKAEPAFDNMVLEFYEDEVTWRISLLIPPGTEPGKKTLRCQAGYQLCDASSCKLPGKWTLPDVVLTVLPGGAAAGAPAAETAQPSASASSTSATGQLSEVAKRAQLGLWPFLLFSALGGLGALVMPCVWPMVPITVNFFVKKGHADKGKTTGLAITYCLAIIGIFTSFGVLCSSLFTAAALQNLATNAWLNAFVAALFLAFGLSLLGLFEIRLPNVLLNASARGESRGGLIGVVFMALTLTITSFTCTFPVVGGLVVMAAGGQFFYPILGLATFSTVLALPFFLLALSPGLLSKLPRSGDWMNAAKIVGGLVEIGAAFKFVNAAEIGFGTIPKDAWFDAPVVLTIWIALAVVCGLYLLGLFRTDHDHDEVKVGPGRLLTGSLMLGLALYLTPALFGNPPRSKVWYTVVGLLPLDVDKLTAPVADRGAAGERRQFEAISKDPEMAQEEQKSFHGVIWGMSYKAAREQARAQNKPILIDFTGVYCANCRTMEQSVLPLPEVVKLLKQFVTVQLYTDLVPIGSLTNEQRLELAAKNQELLLDLAQEATNPFYVVVAPDGQVLNRIGYSPPSVFIDFLNGALNKHQGQGQVAQAAPAH
ncbi:MAG TPA: thioredoxin family protein [Isosphaeraceae bacterium]|nr:thioredoxin family protein [Isosphaeraceae bacterium]